MLFVILLFVALAFIYDIPRNSIKLSKKQIELLEQLNAKNEELIRLLKKEDNI